MKTRIKYTEDQLAYLAYHYKLMNVRDLTKAFNSHFDQERTEEAIKTKLIKCGISCGREPKDRLINRIRLFTEPQKLFIKENYKGRGIAEMTQLFNEYFKTNRTEKQITSFVQNNGITSGLTGHFPKGNKPWNTGTKGKTGANKTSFIKGSIPPKTKPLGSTRIEKDGYVLVKVLVRNGKPRRKYKPKHVHIWEQIHGRPVPKGMAILFKDSDKRNFDPSNLIAISRAQLLRLNIRDYKNKQKEIKDSLLALTKLEAKISELKNGHQ